MKYNVDINADLGEGMGNDEQLMPLISSCSIACGGHYGDDETMRTTIRLALKHGVKVGAHPSFPDKDNFGRKLITMTKSELTESLYFQLLQFYAVCETEDATINHIKLHGALYNYAAIDAPTADAVVGAITETKVRPYLYLQHGSVLHRKAENLIPLKFEAFIDRRYTSEGRLVSRSMDGAVIEEPEVAWNQFHKMVTSQMVESIDGGQINIKADTYCIHGDNANSVRIASYIHDKLRDNNIVLS